MNLDNLQPQTIQIINNSELLDPETVEIALNTINTLCSSGLAGIAFDIETLIYRETPRYARIYGLEIKNQDKQKKLKKELNENIKIVCSSSKQRADAYKKRNAQSSNK